MTFFQKSDFVYNIFHGTPGRKPQSKSLFRRGIGWTESFIKEFSISESWENSYDISWTAGDWSKEDFLKMSKSNMPSEQLFVARMQIQHHCLCYIDFLDVNHIWFSRVVYMPPWVNSAIIIKSIYKLLCKSHKTH